jgi:hypothetical protein
MSESTFTRGQKVLVVGYVEKTKANGELVVEIAGKKIAGTLAEAAAPLAAAAEGDGGQETTPIVDFQETTPIVD